MNERIRQLEQQAISIVLNGNDPDSDVDKMYIPSEFTKKFAELIVREFVSLAEEEIKLVEEFKSTAVKADVIKCHTSKIWHFHKLIDKSKKHFGVER
jgi:hypothetical protein